MNQPLLSQQMLVRPLPKFFPERLRHACAGKRIQFHISASVRERMQVPEDIDVADWAEKYRRVTAIDAHPGRWRNELVPHAVKPMRLASAPHVRQLWCCWPERASKTNLLLNAAMRQLDNGIDSGNIFWLMPNEHEAKKAIGERVIEALRATPRTARLLSRYADDTTRTIIRFRHGPRLFAAWAGSAASVSSFFGKLCIADEIDKAETTGVGKETDILTLFFKRGRDRGDSKFLIVSTPAQGYIYKGTMGCQQVLVYHGHCPYCFDLVNPGSDHLIIPTDATPEDVAHGKVPVSIACPKCGCEWSDNDRIIAYREGDWVAIIGAELERPETIGTHITAYLLPNIPLKEIGEKYLLAKTGGSTEKKAFANGYDCKDHKDEVVDREEEQILKLSDLSMPREVVPSQACCLILLVDTQQLGFYYEVVAFGYGKDLESWQVDHGYLETFDQLRDLSQKRFCTSQGQEFGIVGAFIDSGGGTNPARPKHTRTMEVYEFCSDNRIFRPLKGSRDGAPWRITRLDYYPSREGKKVPIPGGLNLYTINVTIFKNQLASKLRLAPDKSGAFHLHADTASDKSYAKQMCVEYQDERGYWICPEGKPNHFWDIATYRFAAADIMRIRDKVKPADEQPVQQPAPVPTTNHRPGQLPGWFRNRR